MAKETILVVDDSGIIREQLSYSSLPWLQSPYRGQRWHGTHNGDDPF